MSLEPALRREPDAEGLPVRFVNGEEFLIPRCPTKPLFERPDGRWVLTGEEYLPLFAEHLTYFSNLELKQGEKLKDDEAEEYACHSGELQAEALGLNYDVTSEHLKELCDPTDPVLTLAVIFALRHGIPPADGGPQAEEKKTTPSSGSG